MVYLQGTVYGVNLGHFQFETVHIMPNSIQDIVKIVVTEDRCDEIM